LLSEIPQMAGSSDVVASSNPLAQDGDGVVDSSAVVVHRAMTVLDESRGLMHAGSVVGLCDKYPSRHQVSACAKDPEEALLLS